MNWQHFKTFLWLRWRLMVNRVRHAGIGNAIVLAILAGLAVVVSLTLFIIGLLVGALLLDEAVPLVLLVIWDTIVVMFFFFWAIGILVDLQRAELLSLDKFLHLPVTLANAFLINFLGSMINLSTILFVPAMLGLGLGQVIARGAAFLFLLPLELAFLFMMSAVAHQFRGWLAAMMTNQRRRRTVIMVISLLLILLTQLPMLLVLLAPWDAHEKRHKAYLKDLEAVDTLFNEKKIDAAEHQTRREAIIKEQHLQNQIADRADKETVEHITMIVNTTVPLGWLPVGARYLADGEFLYALLPFLGMTALGAWSLRRSYRTTLRLYRGEYNAGKVQPVTPAKPIGPPQKASVGLLEWQLPGHSEYASAVASATFRGLTRAPEAKMVLLTPIIMAIVFSSLFIAQSVDLNVYLRPLIVAGSIMLILTSMTQVVGNQFGFDRGGFRAYVLCGAPRRDILLGKNTAAAPFALVLGLFMTLVLQVVHPMRFDHLLGSVPMLLSMWLIFCIMANWLAMFGPMAVASGVLKQPKPRGIAFVWQFGFMFAFPLALTPVLLPLGIEYALDGNGWLWGVPVFLILSVVEAVVLVFVYRWMLTLQGRVLHAREQRILDVVTAKVD